MKKIFVATVAGTLTILFAAATYADVQSLRGANALNAKAEMFDKRKQVIQKEGFERSWKIQPPTIPHDISKDRVSINENTCLNRCHSEKVYEKEKSPKVGDSHYVDREGKTLKSISMRRYFCMQCHVPQLNASPLVENTF